MTSAEILSRRIADVTQPVKGANAPVEKKVPLTWEEEELTNYEPKRAKAVEIKQREDAKEALRIHQLPHQWNALCEVIAIRCESINARAGRTVLRAVSPDDSHLEIRREDDLGFVMEFDPEKGKVTFSGKVLGFQREYELTVQTRDGIDSTAWFSKTTLTTDQTDELAKAMISALMRFEQ
jgi:hypothetical protein